MVNKTEGTRYWYHVSQWPVAFCCLLDFFSFIINKVCLGRGCQLKPTQLVCGHWSRSAVRRVTEAAVCHLPPACLPVCLSGPRYLLIPCECLLPQAFCLQIFPLVGNHVVVILTLWLDP